MSSTFGDTSWQTILDTLTARAKKDGVIASLKHAKGFEAKINKVRDSIVIRNKLATWISVCAESHYSKSGGIATRLRDEGNLKFRNHDNHGALKLYAESVICAPEYGPELSLAYGNRSAALYHLGHFQDCLQDIDLSLKYRYPKNLEYKLHQRKGQCLNKLGRHKEAIQSFEIAIESLKYIQKLTESKRFSLIKDFNALIKETNSMMLNSDTHESIQIEPVLPPEVPSLGLHPLISGGSSCLDLKTDPVKGRYIVTNQDVHIGDTLFCESPYSSVLLPEHYASHCHHCYKVLLVAVPCLKCTQPRYCSEKCRITSWSDYHQFECGNLDLLHSVGIAHLAQRTVLLSGFERLCNVRHEINKTDQLTSSVPGEDGIIDRYPDVFNLVSHVDDLEPEDLFQYAVTATLLTTSLERRSKFFHSRTSSSFIKSSSSEAEIDEEKVVFVGGVILKHITQLVCNASAIYEVGPLPSSSTMDDVEGSGGVVENNQYRIAVALYPGASLMNHSCDPSVINSFYGSRIIVRSIKKLHAGSEVFNCYGPHYKRHPYITREEMLRTQYHFSCDCDPCKLPEYHEYEDRFSALKCHYCDGPIKNPSNESSLQHTLPCYDCGKEQEYSDRIEAVFVAYDLFKKGMDGVRMGTLSEAVSAFQSCYQIRREAMYAHHREISEVADQLARCFYMMGSFSEAARYLKLCLPSIEERFGPHSIELAHELVKYTDVLLGGFLLQKPGHKISHVSEKLLECQECLERCVSIFELHYGKWNPIYKEIAQKLEETKLIASVHSGLKSQDQ